MRCVGVVPAQVEDPSVGRDGRVVRVVLFEGDLPDAGPVGVHLEHHADDHACVTRDALQGSGGDQGDLATGKPTRIVEVDVVLVGWGELAQAAAVGVDLKDVPLIVTAWHGEQETLGIPIEIDVLQQPPAFGLIHRPDFSVRSGRREDAKIVLPVQRLFDAGIAFRTLSRIPEVLSDTIPAPHGTAWIAVGCSADEQQLIPVEQRIRRQGSMAERVELLEQIEEFGMQFRVDGLDGTLCTANGQNSRTLREFS